MKNILVTGAAGFIGSHFVEHIHRKTDWNIIVVDKLTYASNGLERLRNAGLLDSKRIKVYTVDLAAGLMSEGIIQELGDINIIVHAAAETHIPKSIEFPVEVIHNNVMSTVYLLEYARTLKNLEKFIYFSTDEVYGGAPEGVNFTELDKHNPTNPYSSSKSAAEQICVGYKSVYQIPLIIVNCMNAIGQRQHPEKFVIKCINHILNDKIIPIHADKSCNKPGSRFYIHARNISDAVLFILNNCNIGETYHITGEQEINNLEMAQLISVMIGKDLKYELVDFHSSNHGHDERYSLCGDKLAKLGWTPPVTFIDSLKETVDWTLRNPYWLKE